MREKGEEGASFKEFQQVLPNLSRDQITVLLRGLRKENRAYCAGKTSASRWFAGPMSAAEIEEWHFQLNTKLETILRLSLKLIASWKKYHFDKSLRSLAPVGLEDILRDVVPQNVPRWTSTCQLDPTKSKEIDVYLQSSASNDAEQPVSDNNLTFAY